MGAHFLSSALSLILWVVGNYTPGDSSALVPSPHSLCPTSLGHGAILHGVTSLELPFLVVKQGPYQNCSLTCAVS